MDSRLNEIREKTFYNYQVNVILTRREKVENKIELELLEKFILNSPELAKLEALLLQFNILETLNIVDAKIRHSSVLSWLLSQSANHGFGRH